MERDVLKIVVFFACLLFSVIGVIQGDAIKSSRVRHLLVQRHSPLPGSPRELFKMKHQVKSKGQSSDDENVHKLFSRVRRSLNPDMRHVNNEVQAYISPDDPEVFSELQLGKVLSSPSVVVNPSSNTPICSTPTRQTTSGYSTTSSEPTIESSSTTARTTPTKPLQSLVIIGSLMLPRQSSMVISSTPTRQTTSVYSTLSSQPTIESSSTTARTTPTTPLQSPVIIGSSTLPQPSSMVISSTPTKQRTSGYSTMTTSPTKLFSSFPSRPSVRQNKKSLSYWSIAVAGVGIIHVFLIVYVVLKYRQRHQIARNFAGYVGEEEGMPLPLESVADDDDNDYETLITA